MRLGQASLPRRLTSPPLSRSRGTTSEASRERGAGRMESGLRKDSSGLLPASSLLIALHVPGDPLGMSAQIYAAQTTTCSGPIV